MQVFEQSAFQSFEDRMVVHAQSRFPDQAKKMDEPQLREFIRFNFRRAGKYGVVTEYDVRRYLDCALQYGGQFDRSPTTAWAGRILQTQGPTGREKMDQIDDYQTFVER
jgi:hypothetical protein